MAQDPFFYLILAALAVVVGVLLFGIASFGKGGDFNRKYANKAMRWRLITQFVAVLLIVGFVWLRNGG